MALTRSGNAKKVPTPMESAATPSGKEVAVDQPNASNQFATDNLSGDSLATTPSVADSPSLSAWAESEPKTRVADLSIHVTEDGDKAASPVAVEGNSQEFAVEETANESPGEPVQSSTFDNTGSDSENESMCTQAITVQNTAGLDAELTQHKRESSADEECKNKVQTGGDIATAIVIADDTTQSTSLLNTAGVDVALTQYKRKCSPDAECDDELQTGNDIATAIVINDDTRDDRTTAHRRNKRRKVSVEKYGDSENLWMGNTLQGIETATRNNEEAFRLLNGQGDDLEDLLTGHVHEEIRELLQSQKLTLLSLGRYIISCGAKERKITKNWERSA